MCYVGGALVDVTEHQEILNFALMGMTVTRFQTAGLPCRILAIMFSGLSLLYCTGPYQSHHFISCPFTTH
jgi:hypothetical protein